jgi:hypothetical protein
MNLHQHQQQLPFTPDDFSHQARSALNSLQHVMQVVINAGALLEQELGHALDPPAPRRFLYPRDPKKTAATAASAIVEPATDSDSTEDAVEINSSATGGLLRELHARPPSAKFTTNEAALYMNCRVELLRAWRWQKRGPAFEGKGRFVRYQKRNLDAFTAA